MVIDEAHSTYFVARRSRPRLLTIFTNLRRYPHPPLPLHHLPPALPDPPLPRAGHDLPGEVQDAAEACACVELKEAGRVSGELGGVCGGVG